MRKLVIGLTGGFASGKSTVAAILAKKGARVLDADQIARQALERGKPEYRKVTRWLGAENVLNAKGEIDRIKLAALVFKRPAARKKLENILHPAVFRAFKRAMREHKKGVLVLEVPLLFETGYERAVDLTVMVASSQKEQARRAAKRSGMSREQALARMRAQWPQKVKRARADCVIENNAGLAALKKKTELFWEILTKL